MDFNLTPVMLKRILHLYLYGGWVYILTYVPDFTLIIDKNYHFDSFVPRILVFH